MVGYFLPSLILLQNTVFCSRRSREMDFLSDHSVCCLYPFSTLKILTCPLPACLCFSAVFFTQRCSLAHPPCVWTQCLYLPLIFASDSVLLLPYFLLSVGRNSTRYNILQFQTSIITCSTLTGVGPSAVLEMKCM